MKILLQHSYGVIDAHRINKSEPRPHATLVYPAIRAGYSPFTTNEDRSFLEATCPSDKVYFGIFLTVRTCLYNNYTLYILYNWVLGQSKSINFRVQSIKPKKAFFGAGCYYYYAILILVFNDVGK